MKVRIKFEKYGALKYIGHLDVMRFFQKANRRANLPVAMSKGYSPHQLLTFSNPLGLGMISEGEYMDLELTKDMDCKEIIDRLQEVMVEGMHILDACPIIDEKQNAMASIRACDYEISFEEKVFEEETLLGFLKQEEILVKKKTKKGETKVNIRPMIYEMYFTRGNFEPDGSEEELLYLKLASGSEQNLKVDLLLETLYAFAGKECKPYSYHIKRKDCFGKDPNTQELVNLFELASRIKEKEEENS